jgi:hypothetical protein
MLRIESTMMFVSLASAKVLIRAGGIATYYLTHFES